jgi:hypothetical protein
VEIIDHFLDGEPLADEGLTLEAELSAERGVLFEAQDGVDEPGGVIRGDKQAADAVEADFAGAVAVGCDDGFGGGEGLGHGAGEAFAAGEVDEDVHKRGVGGDLVRGNQAGERDMVQQAEAGGAGFEAGAPGAVADQEEADARAASDEFGGDIEEVVVAFEFEESGDHADDEVIGLEAEVAAELGVGLGVEAGLDGEAAEDAGVLGGLADAGGEVLIAHGMGDDDEVVGVTAGESFGGAKEGIGGGALEGAEGGAVDGMDDDGDAGVVCGEASEDAGFAAMGMDDEGFAGAEEAGELA